MLEFAIVLSMLRLYGIVFNSCFVYTMSLNGSHSLLSILRMCGIILDLWTLYYFSNYFYKDCYPYLEWNNVVDIDFIEMISLLEL